MHGFASEDLKPDFTRLRKRFNIYEIQDLTLSRRDIELLRVENETNLDKALLWASGGDVAVYPIGFNYQSSDGKDSLDGNGQERLKKIAVETGGEVTMVTTLDEIEDQFSIILAKMCELRYKTVGEVPGDGGHHEIPIDVTSGVVEMNIRIACKTADAISNGSRISLPAP